MRFTFVLYEEMTALDLVGPYQVFAAVSGAEVVLAALQPGPKRTDSGMVITADRALADVTESDVLVVPGTSRPQIAAADAALVAWLAGARAGLICVVCTGSFLVGGAGLLKGRRATSHWLARESLRAFGAEPVAERVVFDGPIVSSAGVSAGIDMALAVVGRLCGQEEAETIQLLMEYDPQPPFRSGSPRTAAPALVEKLARSFGVG
jgi:transcriptional regulator GlxA family with amidase domain